MPNNNLNCLWNINRNRLVVMLVGGVTYGLLQWLSGLGQLPNLLIFSLNPAVAIPIFCGLLWGPLVGLVVGAGGSLLHDFLTPDLDFGLFWSVGSGLLGFVPGLAVLWRSTYQHWRHYLVAAVWAWAGVYISLDYTVVRQVAYQALPATDAWAAVFTPALLNNSLNALIFTPLLIWLFQRFSNNV